MIPAKLMSNIAIITARGGSKRIPKKNIRDFCGKPMIAYSIEAAKESGVFDEVMVSTDDDEIAEISKAYGAAVPFKRSKDNSGDFAGTDDVLLEVLDEYRNRGMSFSVMCCLYPTAPFVTADKLKDAYDILIKNEANKLMSVTVFSYPPQRAMIKDNNGKLKFIFPDKYKCRSQDLEKWYHDAGQFYLYNVETFMNNRGVILSGIFPFVIPETEVQDIDNEEDWIIAEMKYRRMAEIRKKD